MSAKKTQTKSQKLSKERPSTQPRREPKTSTAPQSTSKLSGVLFAILLLLAVVAMAALFYLQSIQPPVQRPTVLEDEKYYFTDSRYAGIRSKFN